MPAPGRRVAARTTWTRFLPRESVHAEQRRQRAGPVLHRRHSLVPSGERGRGRDVELLRAVIARTTGRVDRRAQRTLINERLLPLLREAGRPRRPLRLPASFQPLMSEAAARDVAAITAAGCHVTETWTNSYRTAKHSKTTAKPGARCHRPTS